MPYAMASGTSLTILIIYLSRLSMDGDDDVDVRAIHLN